MVDNLIAVAALAGAGLVAIVTIGLVLARLYRRASKERAFVRTGLGGQRVITDGGALVLPVFHETILVNMNTLKLEVQRRAEASLIAKDRMRVDVSAAFFVRVKQTAEAVSTAAQTLGQRTLNPEALKQLVEDKFVDALRSTAATMTMQELQDKRREFVQAVQNAVAEDLEKNGLELESVSLTALDQTDKQYFNPENAFDAEGLTRLTQETQARRKQRNDVEQDTEVQIRTKNLEAQRQSLEIERQQEFAKLDQERQIAITRAEQSALIKQQEAQRTREAEEARIASDQAVNQAKILAERQVRETEIEKNAQLTSRQIEADQRTSVLGAEQRRQIENANQDAQIAIAQKSQQQSVAEAAANEARATAARAEELVATARQVTVAERDKQIELIEAEKTAQQQAIAIKVAAEAEKDAAVNKAEAVRVQAEGARAASLAEAAGRQAINEALNTLSAAQVDLQVRTQLLSQLPSILEQAVRPIEAIDSIRIFQVDGLGGISGGAPGAPGPDGASLPDQVVSSALRYQVAKPLVDAIMKDAGLNGGGMAGIAETLSHFGKTAERDASAKPVDPAQSGSTEA